MQDEKKRALAASIINEEAKAATTLLKERTRGLEDAEAVLQAKYAIQQFSLDDLSKGAKMKRCVDAARKRRWEVLDRLALLGQGMSTAPRNDFDLFKDAWDARMLQEHGDTWPGTSMGWVQRLLGENENGKANACSVFDHNVTRRCFDGVLALRVPEPCHGRSGGLTVAGGRDAHQSVI